MCGSIGSPDLEGSLEQGPPGGIRRVVSVTDLATARHVARSDEVRRTAAGFIGNGATGPGQRVLIGVDTQTDPMITDAIAVALREMGASVDVVIAGLRTSTNQASIPPSRLWAACFGVSGPAMTPSRCFTWR